MSASRASLSLVSGVGHHRDGGGRCHCSGSVGRRCSSSWYHRDVAVVMLCDVRCWAAGMSSSVDPPVLRETKDQ